jgi:hypothetical protein
MNTNGNQPASDGRASMDLEVDAEPFAGMSYLNAVANGRSESTMLGFYRGRASWIPDELEGIVVTADLGQFP